MTKLEFFKRNDKIFLSLGFSRDEQDPMFFYYKNLVSEEQIKEQEVDEDSIPRLLFGNSGINCGFCIYTGYCFVWLDANKPEDAIELSKKIVAFESI